MTVTGKEQLLTLPLGQIKGIERRTIYDESYYSFERIPYAKPPTGKLRFKAPVPIEPWSGIKDCTECGSKPMQKNSITGIIEGSEDCLYLNVYAKKLATEKPLPVMVWIYGGAYCMGSATRDLYSPDYFMDKDVILVTLNYRLCALGFLSLKDESLQVPGNAGLKDQVLALKWVNKYISYFNGDQNNVMVFGVSAGGSSTHYMTITEQTRGLFHKAALMSGCVLNDWAVTPPRDLAYRLAIYNGYEGEAKDELILNYLRQLESDKLIDHQLLNTEDQRNGYLFTFGPCVEPYNTTDCVVPKPPLEMLETAWSNKIPILIGGTADEGLLLYPRLKTNPQALNAFASEPERTLPVELSANRDAEARRELGTKLIKLHFKDKVPSSKYINEFLDFYGIRHFWHGLHRTVLARNVYASASTFLYRFDFDSPDFNHFRTKFCGQDPVRGVSHGDDISYMFYFATSWKLSKDSSEYKTIKRMVAMWTAFAESSDPNCAEIKPALWEALRCNECNRAFNISNDLSVVELPEKAKLEVWDSLYSNQKLF